MARAPALKAGRRRALGARVQRPPVPADWRFRGSRDRTSWTSQPWIGNSRRHGCCVAADLRIETRTHGRQRQAAAPGRVALIFVANRRAGGRSRQPVVRISTASQEVPGKRERARHARHPPRSRSSHVDRIDRSCPPYVLELARPRPQRHRLPQGIPPFRPMEGGL